MNPNIIKAIQSVSVPAEHPDKTQYLKLSLHESQQLANSFTISIREIEITALENNIIPERYARNFNIFSIQEQLKLLNSRVSIAGLGGLGGTVAENLARIGIGTLILIDGDVFEESNLNRQLLSSAEMLDIPKAETAKKRINIINPGICADTHNVFINADNAVSILQNPDVVIDCLDNIKTRFIVEEASKKIVSPLVSAAIAGGYGHVTTIFPVDAGLSLIYGNSQKRESKGTEIFWGNLSYTASFAANIQCSETVKIILNKGKLLRNKLFLFDLNDNIFDIVQI